MTKKQFDEWVAGVVGDSRLTWTVKRTAIATTLFPHAKCVPSARELAQLRHLSEGTVRRHIRTLKDHGYMSTVDI